MEKRTRVIVYGSSLNMAGIATSLKADASLEVICVQTNTTVFPQPLNGLPISAIVFDQSEAPEDLILLLLNKQPSMLLIGVDPSSDEMLVLSSCPEQALSVVDLVNIIHWKDSISETLERNGS